MSHLLTKLGSLVVNWSGEYDEKFMAVLEADGINYDSGKVGVTISAHKVRSGWTYITGAKQITKGQIFITNNYFFALVQGFKMIGIPKDNPLFDELTFDSTNPERLIISIKYDNFPTKYKGTVTMKYKLKPEEVTEWL
jgi:hypothetical protein